MFPRKHGKTQHYDAIMDDGMDEKRPYNNQFNKFCDKCKRWQLHTVGRKYQTCLTCNTRVPKGGLTPDAADRYYRCLGCGANLKGNQVEHEVFHKVVSKDEEGVESVSSCGPVIEQK